MSRESLVSMSIALCTLLPLTCLSVACSPVHQRVGGSAADAAGQRLQGALPGHHSHCAAQYAGKLRLPGLL